VLLEIFIITKYNDITYQASMTIRRDFNMALMKHIASSLVMEEHIHIISDRADKTSFGIRLDEPDIRTFPPCKSRTD
jgi:hypothetical protein